jgi:hypothetical protein
LFASGGVLALDHIKAEAEFYIKRGWPSSAVNMAHAVLDLVKAAERATATLKAAIEAARRGVDLPYVEKICNCKPCRTCGMKHWCNINAAHPGGWVRVYGGCPQAKKVRMPR